MSEGLLSLCWNNHRSTFCHIVADLRKKERYSDATLACNGKFYPVHKLVLTVCSEYFESILDRTPCKHPVIVLQDVQPPDLEALLSYMYEGTVSVAQTDLARLIKAAELLRIKGLAVPDDNPEEKTSHKSSQKHSSSNRESPAAKRKRREENIDQERTRTSKVTPDQEDRRNERLGSIEEADIPIKQEKDDSIDVPNNDSHAYENYEQTSKSYEQISNRLNETKPHMSSYSFDSGQPSSSASQELQPNTNQHGNYPNASTWPMNSPPGHNYPSSKDVYPPDPGQMMPENSHPQSQGQHMGHQGNMSYAKRLEKFVNNFNSFHANNAVPWIQRRQNRAYHLNTTGATEIPDWKSEPSPSSMPSQIPNSQQRSPHSAMYW